MLKVMIMIITVLTAFHFHIDSKNLIELLTEIRISNDIIIYETELTQIILQKIINDFSEI